MIVHLHAYLGKDIENNKNDQGKPYFKLSVAERVSKEEKPQWFTIFCHQLPEKLVSYLKKGSLVYVIGRLTVNLYKGKPNLIINALEVQLLLSKKEEKSE